MGSLARKRVSTVQVNTHVEGEDECSSLKVARKMRRLNRPKLYQATTRKTLSSICKAKPQGTSGSLRDENQQTLACKCPVCPNRYATAENL
jgi:hypothetical protein